LQQEGLGRRTPVLKNKPVLLLLGAIGVFVIIILSCIIYISVAWKGKIVPGVQVEWIEVGGLTQDEAEQKISEVQQEFLSAPVEITASEERVSLSRGELGFSIDAKKPAQRAYQVGREGSISKRISQTWDAYHKQVVIPCPEVMIDTQQVESILASFSEGLDEPQDARLIIDDRDQITIIPSKTGIAVDLDVSLDDLKLFKQPFAGEIELQYKEELDKITRITRQTVYEYIPKSDAMVSSSNDIKRLSQEESANTKILFIFIQSFLLFVGLSNAYNSFNSNLQARRRDFALLRSIGMQEQQLKKMLLYEGGFLLRKVLLIFSVLLVALVTLFAYRKKMLFAPWEIFTNLNFLLLFAFLGINAIGIFAAIYGGIRRALSQDIQESLREN
jgi:hypothetical protein